MASRAWSIAIALIGLPVFSSAMAAQRAKAPNLNEILRRLEANLDRYDANVPALFCREHVVSLRTEPGVPDQTTFTDSIFRLRRISGPGNTTVLAESREIMSVDGQPATSGFAESPTLLSGFFEGGLAVVSLDQSACMSYWVQPGGEGDAARPYAIRFATALASGKNSNCILRERSKGRVFIDPQSTQVMRLEITTPHHVIIPASGYAEPVVGKRYLRVDYAPVDLGGETFWMPSAIMMRNTSGFGFHRVVWLYRASYRSYHRMEVTSRILPGGESAVR